VIIQNYNHFLDISGFDARFRSKENHKRFRNSTRKSDETSRNVDYIRKMANTIKPSDDELRDLFSLAKKVPFDDRLNHEAELSDLNITFFIFHVNPTRI